MSETPIEPFLVVENLGNARGRPIYVVSKHTPVQGQRDRIASISPPLGIRPRLSKRVQTEIRCMDLGTEAFGSYRAQQGGCPHTQFFNDIDDLICTSCGNDFSKFYLRQGTYIEVKGVPN